MFNAYLTLLMAFAVAIVVGWFSIAGIITIYAGAPLFAALVMGIVIECTKLVSLSWLYRNWKSASLLLKVPLVVISFVIMVITNIGVFGFLSKGHLEQGAATIDNSAKVEQIDRQIAQEQSRIADSEKIISQMDGAVNSLIGKDQANRSLTVRKSQAGQRKQLRDEITASQKQIDTWNSEKFALEAEVRKVEHEIGPIKYIAEVFIQSDDKRAIDTAVQIFTLLIVLVLDPAAVMLLLAANHSLNKQNEKQEKEEKSEDPTIDSIRSSVDDSKQKDDKGISIEQNTPHYETVGYISNDQTKNTETPLPIQEDTINEEKIPLASEDGYYETGIEEQIGYETSNEENHDEIFEDQHTENISRTEASILPVEVQNDQRDEDLAQPGPQIDYAQEEAILERFGVTKLPLGAVSAVILQPAITRVQQDVSEASSEPESEDIPTLEELSENIPQGNNEQQTWHWSHHRDGKSAPKKDKEIKTLSWLETFGKK